jgi:hypothetical protein
MPAAGSVAYRLQIALPLGGRLVRGESCDALAGLCDVQNAVKMTVWTPKFLPPSPLPGVFPKCGKLALAASTVFVVTDQAADCIHTLPEPAKAKGQQR